MTAQASVSEIGPRQEAQRRRGVSERLYARLKTAASVADALQAFHHFADEIDQLGKWDDAARARALAKAVGADLAALEREISELEAAR